MRFGLDGGSSQSGDDGKGGGPAYIESVSGKKMVGSVTLHWELTRSTQNTILNKSENFIYDAAFSENVTKKEPHPRARMPSWNAVCVVPTAIGIRYGQVFSAYSVRHADDQIP